MKKGWFVFCAFILLFLFSCGSEEKKETATVIATDSTAWYDSVYIPARHVIDTFFLHRFERDEFNGNILFADKGRVVIHKSYGFKTPGDTDSLGKTDCFQLASVSKTVTSLAVLQLCEAKKLSTDDTLGKYFDSFPYPGITVHMLLCHRAGLSNYNYFADDFSTKTKPFTNDSVIALLYRNRPKAYYPPGTKFDYSNTGYVILASLVERVSGEKFSDYVKKNIFEPAGMKNSFIYSNCDTTCNHKKLCGFNAKGKKVEEHYQDGVVGDKGMYSTAYDLFLFDQALYGEKLLKSESLQKAFTGYNSDRQEKGKDDYGYGWRIKQSFNGYEVVYHTGWWKGFRSWFIRNLTTRQTIILLDNVKRGPFTGVEELLALFDEAMKSEQ